MPSWLARRVLFGEAKMAQGDDAEDEMFARLFLESAAEAMVEVRAHNEKLRHDIGEFFGVAVEHLPVPNTLGWHRMLATYVYGFRKPDLPHSAKNLRYMLEGHFFKDERSS
jgi:hypothetical protein